MSNICSLQHLPTSGRTYKCSIVFWYSLLYTYLILNKKEDDVKSVIISLRRISPKTLYALFRFLSLEWKKFTMWTRKKKCNQIKLI